MVGAIGMMMAGVPFEITVNDVSVVSSGELVTGSLVRGPSGSITWLWEYVSGSSFVQPTAASNPATYFNQTAYGSQAAVWRLKATINGRVALSQNVSISLYAEEPPPPLTGSGSPGPTTVTLPPDVYTYNVTMSVSVSGGSGTYEYSWNGGASYGDGPSLNFTFTITPGSGGGYFTPGCTVRDAANPGDYIGIPVGPFEIIEFGH